MPITQPTGYPPPDLSGGFFCIRAKVAERVTNVERFHVPPFDETTFGYTGGSGTEADIPTTVSALLTQMQALFDANTTLALTSLWQRQTGGMVRVRVPVATSGGYISHAGTSTTTPVNTAQGYLEQIVSGKSSAGGKTRFRLVNVAGLVVEPEGPVAANAAGTPLERLVAYLTGTATQIIAHDFGRYTLPQHQTTYAAKRLRRESMRVA